MKIIYTLIFLYNIVLYNNEMLLSLGVGHILL